MAGEPDRRRVLRLHVGLVLAVVLCSTAFVVELVRALDGNALSWAYVGEWPLLMVYAVYMWHRLVKDERGEPVTPRAQSTAREVADLEAYNEHLARLHAADAAARVERNGT